MPDLTNFSRRYLRLAVEITDRVIEQIKSRNRIDPDFITISKMNADLTEILYDLYADLKNEQAEEAGQSFVSNCKLHVLKKSGKCRT